MHLQQKQASLSKDEQQLLAVKYEKPPIAKMTDDELILHTQGIMFKVHVITGWEIPDDEFYVSVLKDQLFKKLKEDYAHVSVSEIEYAFRTYGTSVKDWGKSMNLKLFDEVMNMYLTARKVINEYEERLAPALPQAPPSPTEILNMKRELVESLYQGFLKGRTSFKLFPEDGIDTLIQDQYCSSDLYQDFVNNAQDTLAKSYLQQIEQARLAIRKNEVKQLEERLAALADDDNVEVKILSKKMALMYCFYKFKRAGYMSIYVKEELNNQA